MLKYLVSFKNIIVQNHIQLYSLYHSYNETIKSYVFLNHMIFINLIIISQMFQNQYSILYSLSLEL